MKKQYELKNIKKRIDRLIDQTIESVDNGLLNGSLATDNLAVQEKLRQLRSVMYSVFIKSIEVNGDSITELEELTREGLK